MATSPILGIQLVAPTQNDKTTPMNDMILAIEGAANDQLPVSLAAGNVTLSPTQFTSFQVFTCSGLTAPCILTVPLSKRVFAVYNNSAFVLTVGGVTGSSVVIAANSGAIIQCDATQCFVFGGGANITRNLGELQAQFVLGTVVTNGTFYFSYKTPYAGTIASLDAVSGVGTFTVAIQINGTPVTGLSAVAVTSTPYTTAATGANTYAAGATISGVITLATGAPTNAVLNLNVIWS